MFRKIVIKWSSGATGILGAIPVCHKTIIPHASSGILKEFHRMLSGSSG